MPLREQDRHFLWSLYSAVAIIFIWKGLWEGIYEIPYFGDPFVFLFIGLAMLTFSGVIFREFDPLGGLEKSIDKVLHLVYNHPHKEDFQIKYYDKSRKEVCLIYNQTFCRTGYPDRFCTSSRVPIHKTS